MIVKGRQELQKKDAGQEAEGGERETTGALGEMPTFDFSHLFWFSLASLASLAVMLFAAYSTAIMSSVRCVRSAISSSLIT